MADTENTQAPGTKAKSPAPARSDAVESDAEKALAVTQATTTTVAEYEAIRAFKGYHGSQLLVLAAGDRVPADVGAALRELGAPFKPVQEGRKERA